MNLVGAGPWSEYTTVNYTVLGVTLNQGVIMGTPSKPTGLQRHVDQTGVNNSTLKVQWTKLSVSSQVTKTEFGGDTEGNMTYHLFGDQVDGYRNQLIASFNHVTDAAEYQHNNLHPVYPVSPGQKWYYFYLRL